MKKAKVFIGTLLISISLISVSSTAGNGNGPNSGSGGNSNNNGNQGEAWILHNHGNGTYSLMHVTSGAMAGHAAHGDMWYKTGCPLTGPVNACFE
jgi:hypothetical protein